MKNKKSPKMGILFWYWKMNDYHLCMNQKYISIILVFFCFTTWNNLLYAKSEFLPYAEVLSSIGIIQNKKTEEGYELTSSLSRWEAIQLILRMVQNNQRNIPVCNWKNTTWYVDVGRNLWSICGSIYEALRLGIIQPWKHSKLYPKKPITRWEFSQLLGRLIPSGTWTHISESTFLDVKNLNSDMQEWINKLENQGCLNLHSSYFYPNQLLLKGEAYKLSSCFIRF